MMGWFGGKKKEDEKEEPEFLPGPARDIKWVKTSLGTFHQFTSIDVDEVGLRGRSGVYVLWHGGVRPAWVQVGSSDDLAATFRSLVHEKDIMQYDVRGRLFVTWSFVKKEWHGGVVKFLEKALQPLEQTPTKGLSRSLLKRAKRASLVDHAMRHS